MLYFQDSHPDSEDVKVRTTDGLKKKKNHRKKPPLPSLPPSIEVENVTAAIESAAIFWPDTFSTDNSFHGGLGSDGRAERFPFLTRGGLRGSEWDVFLAGQQQQQRRGTDPAGNTSLRLRIKT